MTPSRKISSAIFISERKPIRLPTLLGNCCSNAWTIICRTFVVGSRVEGITASNLGRQILPIVNGHAMQPLRLYSKPVTSGKLAVMGGFSPADLAAMAEFIPPADPKREEPINKLAAVTKPLLPSKDPAQEKKEAKDPEEHKDRTVISTRRGRI